MQTQIDGLMAIDNSTKWIFNKKKTPNALKLTLKYRMIDMLMDQKYFDMIKSCFDMDPYQDFGPYLI